MKESVLSFEEKITHSWLTYFKIAGKYETHFKTNPLNIIFDYFSIWLLVYMTEFSSISSTSALFHKYCVAMKYRWICKFLIDLLLIFCRFCVVIRFFHPRHNGQWPQTSKDFYTRSYPLHYFLILILEKEPVFSLFNVEC